MNRPTAQNSPTKRRARLVFVERAHKQGKSLAKALATLLIAVLLSACGQSDPTNVTFHASDAYPERLSDWGLVSLKEGQLSVSNQALIYDLNTPLFSDYALKLRTLYLPDGTQAEFHPEQTLGLPVGSIISKTFLYPKNASGQLLTTSTWNGDPNAINAADFELVETRLLVRQAHGWDALPYVWDGGDAYLQLTGTIRRFTLAHDSAPQQALNYLVPSKNQCASCHATNHTTGELQPIGMQARHLDRTTDVYNRNQLEHWTERGWLTNVVSKPQPNAVWGDTTQTLEHQARSYLDINCGHCHNANGAADTSGLLLDYKSHPANAMGVCKPPIAAGRGSGGHLYSIVPGQAEDSILSFRLATNDPGMMMPELGRSLVHQEGLTLINRWIGSLEGQCL